MLTWIQIHLEMTRTMQKYLMHMLKGLSSARVALKKSTWRWRRQGQLSRVTSDNVQSPDQDLLREVSSSSSSVKIIFHNSSMLLSHRTSRWWLLIWLFGVFVMVLYWWLFLGVLCWFLEAGVLCLEVGLWRLVFCVWRLVRPTLGSIPRCSSHTAAAIWRR